MKFSVRVSRHDRDIVEANCHILVNTATFRVLFKSRTAAGLNIVGARDAHYVSVSAKKEVIIAAGAVYTPQVLRLSDLGDAKKYGGIGQHRDCGRSSWCRSKSTRPSGTEGQV